MQSNGTNAYLLNWQFLGVQGELTTHHVSLEVRKSKVNLVKTTHTCRRREACIVYVLLSILSLTQK